MTLSLAEWQTRFLEGVRRNGDASGLFRETARAPSLALRFEVYREGYWLRVSGSLAEDFPLLARLFGEASFTRAMRAFLEQRRPRELELGEVSPAFAAYLLPRISRAAGRALKLDLLALEARRAPEPEPRPGGGYGLHPSARFLRDGHRGYVLWRAEGEVRRERLPARAEGFLLAFREPAGAEELGARLESLGEDPAFVQGTVAEWTAAGLFCWYEEAT